MIDTINWWENNLTEYSNTLIDAISNKQVSMGMKTREFEEAIAEFLNAKYVLCYPSGTAAITAAIMQRGDDIKDVYLPNRTWIGTANAASILGKRLIAIDSDNKHQNMSASGLAKSIERFNKKENPGTVIFVAINGSYKNIDMVQELVSQNKLGLIIDGCQAFGSEKETTRRLIKNGHTICYSFGMPKLISTGLGGCLATNNEQDYNNLIAMRNQGLSITGQETGLAAINGFNFKYTDMQACLGIEQMKKVEIIIDKHMEIIKRYREGLNGSFAVAKEDADNAIVPLRMEIICEDAKMMAKYLKTKNIQSSLRTDNIIDHPCFQGKVRHLELNNSGYYSGRILVLPSGPKQKLESVEKVIETLNEYQLDKVNNNNSN